MALITQEVPRALGARARSGDKDQIFVNRECSQRVLTRSDGGLRVQGRVLHRHMLPSQAILFPRLFASLILSLGFFVFHILIDFHCDSCALWRSGFSSGLDFFFKNFLYVFREHQLGGTDFSHLSIVWKCLFFFLLFLEVILLGIEFHVCLASKYLKTTL